MSISIQEILYNDVMNKFTDNLMSLRKACGLSQFELAQKIGVTQQCVSEWERGKIEPTLSNLWNLSDVFDVSIDFLVGKKDY